MYKLLKKIIIFLNIYSGSDHLQNVQSFGILCIWCTKNQDIWHNYYNSKMPYKMLLFLNMLYQHGAVSVCDYNIDDHDDFIENTL